jgi:hypothetical protein
MGDVSYPDISIAQGTDVNSSICADLNHAWVMSTAGFKVFNVTAIRHLYEVNNQYLNKYPELASSAYVSHDTYSNAGVHKFKSEDSAFPFRDYNHLTYVNPQIKVPCKKKFFSELT